MSKDRFLETLHLQEEKFTGVYFEKVSSNEIERIRGEVVTQ